jgi:hypothetical protein
MTVTDAQKYLAYIRIVTYEGYSESKDTSPGKMQGIFFSQMPVLPCERGTVWQGRVHQSQSWQRCACSVFKMAVSIQNPAKCEVCVVIRFLRVKGETAPEIHHQLVSVYGDDVMNGKMWKKGVVNLKQEELIFIMK